MAEPAGGQPTPNPQTTDGVDDSLLLEALGDEQGGVEGGGQAADPPQGFMTAAQVEQLLSNQTSMIAQHLQGLARPVPAQDPTPAQPPQPQPAQIMPTAAEVRSAFESADPDAFIDVYNRGLQAVHMQNEQRIQELEQAGNARIQQLAQDTVQGVVPDEYRDAVNGLMDEFNLDPSLRTNRQILSVLTDAARGRNLDQEVNRQIEARVRQAANRRTAEPTSTRTPRGSDPEEPIFGLAAMQALRNAGRTPDQHAQQQGYDNWEDFVASTQEKYDNWQERSVPAWRKRLNERRNKTGRRAS